MNPRFFKALQLNLGRFIILHWNELNLIYKIIKILYENFN